MKYWVSIAILIVLTGCSSSIFSQYKQTNESSSLTDQNNDVSAHARVTVELEDYGPAPELLNEVWLNTDTPLRLAELRGKVVLLDMWTFG